MSRGSTIESKAQVTQNEAVFARKLVRVLDEDVARLPDATLDRLAAARRIALARKKVPATVSRTAAVPSLIAAPGAPVLAGAGMAGGSVGGTGGGFGSAPRQQGTGRRGRFRPRLQMWVPVALLLASLAGIAHWEEQRRVAELASLDAAVLSDALPLDAYLDHGFNEYLARNRNQ